MVLASIRKRFKVFNSKQTWGGRFLSIPSTCGLGRAQVCLGQGQDRGRLSHHQRTVFVRAQLGAQGNRTERLFQRMTPHSGQTLRAQEGDVTRGEDDECEGTAMCRQCHQGPPASQGPLPPPSVCRKLPEFWGRREVRGDRRPRASQGIRPVLSTREAFQPHTNPTVSCNARCPQFCDWLFVSEASFKEHVILLGFHELGPHTDCVF